METDWDLEDWLLDTGEQAERKKIASGPHSLTPAERLIREVWLLDMETRNGGVSQYFCNRGLNQWQSLRQSWLHTAVPSLGPVISEIERIVAGAADPYVAALNASPGIEAFYEQYQSQVLAELRTLLASET